MPGCDVTHGRTGPAWRSSKFSCWGPLGGSTLGWELSTGRSHTRVFLASFTPPVLTRGGSPRFRQVSEQVEEFMLTLNPIFKSCYNGDVQSPGTGNSPLFPKWTHSRKS